MTSFHSQFYICYAYKKKPQFSLEYYSNITLLQKSSFAILQSRRLFKQDRLKKNFLSNFRTFHSNKLRSINTTHAPISAKNQQSSLFPTRKNQTINGNRVSTNYHPFPVATRVHRFKELSRIRPPEVETFASPVVPENSLNSPRRELDNENFELVQTEPHLIALETSLDRLYRASLYAIHSDRFSHRDIRMRPKPKAPFTHSY